jgi:hypothetical protein
MLQISILASKRPDPVPPEQQDRQQDDLDCDPYDLLATSQDQRRVPSEPYHPVCCPSDTVIHGQDEWVGRSLYGVREGQSWGLVRRGSHRRCRPVRQGWRQLDDRIDGFVIGDRHLRNGIVHKCLPTTRLPIKLV